MCNGGSLAATELEIFVQAKLKARRDAGVPAVEAMWPLLLIALFYDKSMLSDSSTKYVPYVELHCHYTI